MYQIEDIQKEIHFLFSRGINWRKQEQHLPKIRRFISVTFNVRSAKKLPSGLLQKKIEVTIILYIAKRSYVENAETTFSIFAKNVLNRYDYPVPLTLLLFFF